MTPLFHVGEIAVVVNCDPVPIYQGSECTVIGDLCKREVAHPFMPQIWSTVTCYEVLMCDGEKFLITPDGLRKRFEPGSWSALRDIFRPKPVECEA